MTDNRDLTFVNIETKGFQDLCNRIAELEKENEFLEKQNKALKIRCSDYCLRVNKLECEIQDMKFTRNYLTSEEAGARFAQELLGIDAEEKAIADGEAHYEMTWNLNGGDDF